MKLSEITVGQTVKVRRGFTVRTSIIDSIRSDGTVGVSYVYTKAERDSFHLIPPMQRSGLYGCHVRPNAITEA